MNTVVVKYQTQKNYCACCNQKLPQAVMSKVREFTFSKESAMSYVNWNDVAEYPEDMESVVPDFVHETICFYATDIDEKIIIEDSEIERVREFILNEVVTPSPHP